MRRRCRALGVRWRCTECPDTPRVEVVVRNQPEPILKTAVELEKNETTAGTGKCPTVPRHEYVRLLRFVGWWPSYNKRVLRKLGAKAATTQRRQLGRACPSRKLAAHMMMELTREGSAPAPIL